MSFRRIRFVMFALAAGLMFAEAARAQQASVQPGDLRLRQILKQLQRAPDYGGSGALGGGTPSTIFTEWLRIEAQFESKMEWGDDILLKFYVLMGKQPNFKMFSGELTHVNVARGTQHYSAMFVHPNTVRRYGAGQVEAVAVQIFYQGRLMDQLSEPKTNQRWWEQFSPLPGYVLNPLQTPWSVIANQRYEPIKATP